MSNKILYGFGLNKIPETVQFGKNIILLKKLYYNNILSIKDRNLHNIEGIKNVPVSDDFVKIIMDIVTKQKPSLHNINKLKSNEKELYKPAPLDVSWIDGSGSSCNNNIIFCYIPPLPSGFEPE